MASREPRSAEEYTQLYAAQQALSWATEPKGFKAPYEATICTSAGSEGCPSESCQALS
jgi:hypothetical protein